MCLPQLEELKASNTRLYTSQHESNFHRKVTHPDVEAVGVLLLCILLALVELDRRVELYCVNSTPSFLFTPLAIHVEEHRAAGR